MFFFSSNKNFGLCRTFLDQIGPNREGKKKKTIDTHAAASIAARCIRANPTWVCWPNRLTRASQLKPRYYLSPFLQEKSIIWIRAYWWLRIYMVECQILIHIISIKINCQLLTFPHTFTCLFMFSIKCILTLQNFITQEYLFIDFMLFSLNSLLEATIFHS